MARITKQMFVTRNRNKKDKKLKGGIASFGVLHETANTKGATALSHYKWIAGSDQFYAHAYVDWLNTLQFIPWNEYGNHAKEPANSEAIGVEMCRPKGHRPDLFAIVYRESVELFARLFYYGYIRNSGKVTKDNLMSHDEVRLKWKKTDHTDPTALLKQYGKSMDGFRMDVQETLDKLKGTKNTERTYTVAKGDSLWIIAAKLLGNGKRYEEIKILNKLATDAINIGQILKIPSK